MSNRRFVLPVTFTAILLAWAALTACGGGPAATIPTATSVPAVVPTVTAPADTPAPTATQIPTQVPAVTSVPAVVTTVAAPADTPAPTDTPVYAPTAIQIPTQVPTATPLPQPFDGTYILIVSQPSGETYSGKVVRFKINGREAAESVMWEQGGIEELNLTASSTAQLNSRYVLVAASRRGGPLAAPLLQAPPLAPQVFVGKAAIDGRFVPQGSSVSAWVDGVQVPEAEATVEASSAASSSGTSPVGQALASIGDNLVRVWKFDASTQSWTFYDPRPLFGSFNSIMDLSSGQFYYLVTKNGQMADLNGQQRTLYAGWTPLVW